MNTFPSSGNVGINTSYPTYDLVVDGNIAVTGGLQTPDVVTGDSLPLYLSGGEANNGVSGGVNIYGGDGTNPGSGVVQITGGVQDGLSREIIVSTDVGIDILTLNNIIGPGAPIKFHPPGQGYYIGIQAPEVVLDQSYLLDLPTRWQNATYTPTVSSDWNATPPTTLGEAIDRLAALIKLLNNGVGA